MCSNASCSELPQTNSFPWRAQQTLLHSNTPSTALECPTFSTSSRAVCDWIWQKEFYLRFVHLEWWMAKAMGGGNSSCIVRHQCEYIGELSSLSSDVFCERAAGASTSGLRGFLPLLPLSRSLPTGHDAEARAE